MATARGEKSQAIQEYMAANKEANVQEIFDGLKAKGVKVSLGLVKAVKYGKKGKKSAARKARRVMAGLSMSDSIRQYISKHSNAGPKDIQAGLKAEGIKVKLGLISAVKYSKAKKAGKKRKMRASVVHAAARRTSKNGVTVEQLIEVKRLADSLGGAEAVRQALDTLAQLQ
jgi:hypothetical protein